MTTATKEQLRDLRPEEVRPGMKLVMTTRFKRGEKVRVERFRAFVTNVEWREDERGRYLYFGYSDVRADGDGHRVAQWGYGRFREGPQEWGFIRVQAVGQ